MPSVSSPRLLRLLVIIQTAVLLAAVSLVAYGPPGHKVVAIGIIALQIILVLGIGSMKRLAVIAYAAVLLVSTFYTVLTSDALGPMELVLQLLIRGAILLGVIPYWGRFR